MYYRSRILKDIALILLIAFTFTFALPINMVKATDSSYVQQQAQVPVPNIGNINNQYSELAELENNLKSCCEKLEHDFKYQDENQFCSSIAETRQVLQELKHQMLAELEQNESILTRINAASALKRNQRFRAALEEKSSELDGLLNDIESFSMKSTTSSPPDYDSISDKLEQIKKLINPEVPQPPLGNDLPHQNIQLTPPAPSTGGGTTPAYPSVSEASSGSGLPFEPTPEDLELNRETQFTTIC